MSFISLSFTLCLFLRCDAVVVVTRVFEGSAAEQSGVQAGDLIVALNGDRIPSEYTKDDILEVLVGAARPLTISFKERL
jgi:S1-C subfamily serine protease